MLKLGFIVSSFAAVALATDVGLESFRATFRPQVVGLRQALEKASRLNLASTALGVEISGDQCRRLGSEIAGRSRLNPFHLVFKEGSSDFFLCGGPGMSASRFFLSHHGGRTALGLPYSSIIQARYTGFLRDRQYVMSVFLDDNMRMVAKTIAGVSSAKAELLESTVEALDARGNFYANTVYAHMQDAKHGIVGPNAIQKYVAADGSVPWVAERNSEQSESAPNRSFRVEIFSRADKRDWDRFDLVFSHAWNGGFYTYGHELRRDPQYMSELTIVSRDGGEACSYGWTKVGAGDENRDFQNFPADPAERTRCSNL